MRHKTRPYFSLNGLWDFAFLGALETESFSPANLGPLGKMPVPSAFDALPGHAGQRGAAVYRTCFTVPPGQAARIEFGAVSMWTRIFINGEFHREHACGYVPFVVDVPASPRSSHELVVLVDNRFDFNRVPMHEEYFDFYQYGGILRDVTLCVLPGKAAFIEAVQVTPTSEFRDGGVEIAVKLGGVIEPNLTLATQFDDGTELLHAITADHVTLALKVPAPRIWSPATPQLHRLRVTLRDLDSKQEYDDFNVRFGLRRIEAHDGALWLNGEKLRLRGYNRHEWHPNFGPCTPVLQMVADLQLLRDLGCNFVRGSHYPQDQRFLDLCDELGMLVWEENLGWGQREATFRSEKFHRDHDAALRAMVGASYNHPSVIIWGFLNEAGTDQDYPRPLLEKTVTTLRELDPSRLLSYASMFALTDRHLDLVDLIALNVYPGWYGCEGVDQPLELVAPFMRECFAHLDTAGFAHKPIIISEIGAEALYGWRDSHHDFYTEEFQAAYLQRACAEALGNTRCSGIALWHFSDVRTYSGGRSLKRPRTFNNKGTLDEYRRPKLAYNTVRAIFLAAGALEIAPVAQPKGLPGSAEG